MQVPPTDRIAAFRPLGAEQLSLAALSPAVATVRPQPVSEVDTNGPDGDATDQERANTESLVRLFTSQSDEATYERQIQRAQREQAQALERRLEARGGEAGPAAAGVPSTGIGGGGEPISSAGTNSGSGSANSGATDSPIGRVGDGGNAARAGGLQAATSAGRTVDPVRPPRSSDAEPSPPATPRLDNGAPVQTTPSSEPLAVSRGPRPADVNGA